MASSVLQPLSFHGRLYLASAPALFPFRQYINTAKSAETPSKASLAFILAPGDEQPPPAQTSVSRPRTRARARNWRDNGQRICVVEGCTKQAKLHKKCWHHGGSRECKASGCGNRAKKKGVCWAHGGGKLCSMNKCQTVAVSNGVCWAHGGGRRCRKARCSRPAYGNADRLCKLHANPEERQNSPQ